VYELKWHVVWANTHKGVTVRFHLPRIILRQRLAQTKSHVATPGLLFLAHRAATGFLTLSVSQVMPL